MATQAKQKQGHTPTPWKVIVRACNAHDDLVTALRGMLEEFDVWDDEEEEETRGPSGSRAAAKARNKCVRAYAAGKAALAKVGD